ncbi:MAG: radical SAM protein [Nanoarchaeota archaeon]|nr:radical SAM protein [Nanoarchaeota archaeon]
MVTKNTGYLSLNKDCSLKILEYPSIFNKQTNELFKINENTLDFIKNNQNIKVDEIENNEFIDYLIKEKIYERKTEPIEKRNFQLVPSPSPSLRYLLIHLTEDCNLRCKHCYLGDPGNNSLPFEDVKNLLNEMESSQGLTVLFSGGEPLKYDDFWKLNEILPKYNMSFELLSNGTLITEEDASQLNINNIQISLDGLEHGHEFMRGVGTYKKTVHGIKHLLNANNSVSIATMVHKNNLDEFGGMKKLLDEYDIKKWIVSHPFDAGRWENNQDYAVDKKAAANIMKRYSKADGGPHKSCGNYACGTHLLTMKANGDYSSCSLLEDSIGNMREMSLENAWEKKTRIKLSELIECSPCKTIQECRGGCRYNAQKNGNIYGKDPLACEMIEV